RLVRLRVPHRRRRARGGHRPGARRGPAHPARPFRPVRRARRAEPLSRRARRAPAGGRARGLPVRHMLPRDAALMRRRRAGDGGAWRRAGAVVLVGGLGYVFAALAATGEASAREVLLRYAFVAAGVFAIAPPHVLLPDGAVRLVQLLNPSPHGLLLRQLRPWGLVAGAFLVPPALLAVELGGAWAALAETGLLV